MDKAYSVKRTSDGGYIVAGRTGSYGSGNADIFLMKLDGNGNVVWARAYEITSDGGFVVGYSIIVKTNSSGNVQWYRVLGGRKWMLSIPLINDSGNADVFSVEQDLRWITMGPSLLYKTDLRWGVCYVGKNQIFHRG